MTQRRKRVVIVGGFSLALGVWLVAVPRTRPQPTYDGHPISYWVVAAARSSSDEQDTAVEKAFEHIGTNALPCLLDWVSYETPALKRSLVKILTTRRDRFIVPLILRLIPSLRSGEPPYVSFTPQGFASLGPAALPALRELGIIAGDVRHPEPARRALRALSLMGPTALPALINVLGFQAASSRARAAHIISELGTNAVPAVPHLVACLEDKDENVADYAANALGQLALCPATVFPALARAATKAPLRVRFDAIWAMTSFDQKEVPLKITLQGLQKDPDPDIREAVRDALAELRR